jgi:RNA polymerase sigma-70 factor (ECF subfamily)
MPGSTERRLILLAGTEAPSESRMPSSEFHRRWLELDLGGAATVDRVTLAFDFCHRMVYAVASRITGSRWDAEDVTQNVFESFARSLHRVRDPARIPGFLKVSAVRTAMHHVKRHQWRRERLAARFEVRQGSSDPGDVALVVRQLLDRMPIEERTALVLKYGEGMDHAEVAEHMGLSVATVRRRIDSAKERLAKRLGNDGLEGLLAHFTEGER